MSKKKNDDEYQLPEDEYTSMDPDDFHEDVYADASDDQSDLGADSIDDTNNNNNDTKKTGIENVLRQIIDKFPILQNKKILILVGVVIIVMIVLQFVGTPTKKVEVSAAATPSVQDQQLSVLNDLKTQIGTLSDSQKKNQTSLSSLQRQVNSMSSTVSSINRSQEELSRSLRTLNASLSAIKTDVDDFSKQSKDSVSKDEDKTPVSTPKAIKPESYTLRAIESGRGWILDEKGNSQSVSVGDDIPDYGKVTNIDPANGVIETSLGKRITFKPDGQ